MRRILIINPFGIGDVLFTTPVIRAIKEKHPDSVIGYWCNERVADLLKTNPDIDKAFPLSRGDIKRVYGGLKGADKGLKGIGRGLKGFAVLVNLIRAIRKEGFDTTFDFSLDSRYGLWSKLAGIKKRIGFDYKGRGRFLTDKIGLDGYSDKHVVEYYLDLLKFIGIKTSSPGLDAAYKGGTGRGCVSYNLYISKENSAKAKSILTKHGIASSDLIIGIAMGGGASWGKDALYKHWPADKFAQLVDRLIKESNARVVLLGSIDEKPLAEIASSRLNARSNRGGTRNDDNCIVNLTGKLDLEELSAVIKELKILVCNDGGPLHMAVALGVNTVSIFGPVDEKVYGPYPPGQKHVVIKKDLSCRPCYENFRFKGCSNNRQCLEGIAVDEVYQATEKLLKN